MTVEPRIDIIGSALSDPSRARILCELMDGRAFTNKELACTANITAQTASTHLKVLGGAGLTKSARSGRHIYHRIANQGVADALEALAGLSPTDHLHRARRSGRPEADALVARSCYSHIAGRLGVCIAHSLTESGTLIEHEGAISVHPPRMCFFRQMGIEVPELGRNRRPFVKCCLDWTERRNHISGPLGSLLMQRSFDAGWL